MGGPTSHFLQLYETQNNCFFAVFLLAYADLDGMPRAGDRT